MKLFPSLLSANFACLNDDVESVAQEVDQLHLDVMDGHFVPNISFGPPVIDRLTEAYPDMNWDAHLMISDPEQYFEDFVNLGMNWISVHVETDPDVRYLSREIVTSDIQLGLAFNPSTPVSDLNPHLEYVDYVLAMTVQPGFSGQSFREDVLEKIQRLRNHYDGPIQVDGGVGEETIEDAVQAGADWFVSGSSVFGADDPVTASRRMMKRASAAR
jgi:ribulose-phosphate 3-epimerase